jgi:hypothetical protein
LPPVVVASYLNVRRNHFPSLPCRYRVPLGLAQTLPAFTRPTNCQRDAVGATLIATHLPRIARPPLKTPVRACTASGLLVGVG